MIKNEKQIIKKLKIKEVGHLHLNKIKQVDLGINSGVAISNKNTKLFSPNKSTLKELENSLNNDFYKSSKTQVINPNSNHFHSQITTDVDTQNSHEIINLLNTLNEQVQILNCENEYLKFQIQSILKGIELFNYEIKNKLSQNEVKEIGLSSENKEFKIDKISLIFNQYEFLDILVKELDNSICKIITDINKHNSMFKNKYDSEIFQKDLSMSDYSAETVLQKVLTFSTDIVTILGDKFIENLKVSIKNLEKTNCNNSLYKIERFENYISKSNDYGCDLIDNDIMKFNEVPAVEFNRLKDYENDINSATQFILDKMAENFEYTENNTSFENKVLSELSNVYNKLNNDYPFSSRGSNHSIN